MALGGQRRGSWNLRVGVTIPGVSTVHVVKSRAGTPMMQTKDYMVGTTLSPGQREAFIGRCEGVKEDVLSDGI